MRCIACETNVILIGDNLMETAPFRNFERQYERSRFQPAAAGCHDDCGRGGRAVDADHGKLHETLEFNEVTDLSDVNRRLEYFHYSVGLGVMSLAEVRLQEGESLENALRRFKRKVMTEDIIKDVKRHSYYLKPGERRRVKQALAQKRARKKIRKDSDQVTARRGMST